VSVSELVFIVIKVYQNKLKVLQESNNDV